MRREIAPRPKNKRRLRTEFSYGNYAIDDVPSLLTQKGHAQTNAPANNPSLDHVIGE
jgi:hypothetical protein